MTWTIIIIVTIICILLIVLDQVNDWSEGGITLTIIVCYLFIIPILCTAIPTKGKEIKTVVKAQSIVKSKSSARVIFEDSQLVYDFYEFDEVEGMDENTLFVKIEGVSFFGNRTGNVSYDVYSIEKSNQE